MTESDSRDPSEGQRSDIRRRPVSSSGSEVVTIEEDFEEIAFYIEQGLHDDAWTAIREAAVRHGPRITKFDRYRELKESLKQATSREEAGPRPSSAGKPAPAASPGEAKAEAKEQSTDEDEAEATDSQEKMGEGAKGEETKAKEAKGEEAKGEEAKAAEAKTAETDVEEGKAEEGKGEEGKAEKSKGEEGKGEEGKGEEGKGVEGKGVEGKGEEGKGEEGKGVEGKGEEGKAEEAVKAKETKAKEDETREGEGEKKEAGAKEDDGEGKKPKDSQAKKSRPSAPVEVPSGPKPTLPTRPVMLTPPPSADPNKVVDPSSPLGKRLARLRNRVQGEEAGAKKPPSLTRGPPLTPKTGPIAAARALGGGLGGRGSAQAAGASPANARAAGAPGGASADFSEAAPLPPLPAEGRMDPSGLDIPIPKEDQAARSEPSTPKKTSRGISRDRHGRELGHDEPTRALSDPDSMAAVVDRLAQDEDEVPTRVASITPPPEAYAPGSHQAGSQEATAGSTAQPSPELGGSLSGMDIPIEMDAVDTGEPVGGAIDQARPRKLILAGGGAAAALILVIVLVFAFSGSGQDGSSGEGGDHKATEVSATAGATDAGPRQVDPDALPDAGGARDGGAPQVASSDAGTSDAAMGDAAPDAAPDAAMKPVRLTLEIEPKEARPTVVFRGKPYRGAPFESPAVEPGKDEESVMVRAPGYETLVVKLTLDRDTTREVALKERARPARRRTRPSYMRPRRPMRPRPMRKRPKAMLFGLD